MRKGIKKQVQKDVRRDLRKRPTPSRKHQNTRNHADPINLHMQQARTSARQAALASLDPISAVERGYLPGVCDGEYNSTVRWSSQTKVNLAMKEPIAGVFAAQWMVAPVMVEQIVEVTSWDAGQIPLTWSALNDATYTSAATNFSRVRCVAMMAEVRCESNPLQLSGTRTLVLGDRGMLYLSPTAIYSKKEAYTIGNNKAGEVSRMPWVTSSPPTFKPITATSNDAYELPCIFAVLYGQDANDVFTLTVTTIWEALPLNNSIAPVMPFVGDPSTYAAALATALSKVPLNSHTRVSYTDDGVIESAASDVRTILGAGMTAFKAGTSLVGNVTRGLSAITGLLSAENKEDQNHDLIVAAFLSLLEDRECLESLLAAISGKSVPDIILWYKTVLNPGQPIMRTLNRSNGGDSGYVSLNPLRLARSS